MKFYISGKVTGLEREEAYKMFEYAKSILKSRGIEGLNPMDIAPYQEHLTWEDYMVEDIRALFVCDGILMLPNWKDSKGAKVEKAIAEALDLHINYLEDFTEYKAAKVEASIKFQLNQGE